MRNWFFINLSFHVNLCFSFETIYNIVYNKIYQLALLVRRNVVVLLPVTLTDVAG